MIIHNVTTKVSAAIHEQWLQWMKDEHIPSVLGTGCFVEHTMLRLLEVDDSDGPTYAVQYKAKSKAFYNQYIERYKDVLRQQSFDKWGDQIISFGSVMVVVN